MMQPGDNEKDVLTEFLTGGSALSCTYQEQAKEEPSAAVDETLRMVSRRELNTGPQHIINPFGRHWTVPASLAAMFLLSVGLVMFLSDETGLSQRQTDMLEEKISEPEMARSKSTASDDAGLMPDSSVDRVDRSQKKKGVGKQQPATATQPTDLRKSIEMDSSGARPQKSRQRKETRGFVSDEADGIIPAAKKPEVSAPALQMEMAIPTESTVLAPELWLQNIIKLRKQGKTREAEASLVEFRKIYPDYPLDSLHN